MKSILFIAPQPFFMLRGTPINVREMVSTLANDGYDVNVVTLPYGTDPEISGVKVHRCLKIPFLKGIPIGLSIRKILYDILVFLKASSFCMRNRVALIHGVEEGGVMATLLGKMLGVPVIYDVDSSVSDGLKAHWVGRLPGVAGLYRRIERFCFKRSAAILTVCSALSDEVRKASPGSFIWQIEDFPLEQSGASDSVELRSSAEEDLRMELGLEGKQVLVYTGNLESYQGIDLFIRALGHLAAKDKNFKAVLAGGTQQEIEHYRALAQEVGCDDHLVFAGKRPADEMPDFYKLADVLVSPRSVGVNTPLKLYSYMAAKRPIVATSILSHTQVLDESSAYLAEPSPEAFSQALLRALDGSESAQLEREKRVSKAAHLVETKYSRIRFRKEVVKLYQEVARRSGWETIDGKPSEIGISVGTSG